MSIYSHSRLSSFEQCPYRYKLRYIDKIKPEIEKSIEAHLGTCVHDTLEWVYTEVKNKRIPSIDDAIIYYSNKWQDEFKENFVIVKKELTTKDYFNKGVQFVLNYYMKNKPFEDGTLELEKKIFITLTNEHKLIGFIDRLAYNPKTKQYEVHDYKTANSLPTQKKMDEDRQLALYSIAIKELFGQDKEVILIWHYLAHDQKIISYRTNEQLTQLKEDTINLIKKIELTTQYPCQKSILCNWCEFKSMCKAHGNSLPHEFKDKGEILETISPSSASEHINRTKEKSAQSNLNDYPFLKKYIKD